MYNSSGNSLARVHKNAFPLAAGPEATSYEKTAAVTLNLISYTIKSIICFPAQLAASCAPGNYFAPRARSPLRLLIKLLELKTENHSILAAAA
jgi:hypothetical protein